MDAERPGFTTRGVHTQVAQQRVLQRGAEIIWNAGFRSLLYQTWLNKARDFTRQLMGDKCFRQVCSLSKMRLHILATGKPAHYSWTWGATWKWYRWALTHWGRVTHICVGKLTIIGSDNGLSPGRRQAIIRTNAGILLIRPLGTNFSEILIEILIFSFKKMRLKVSSAKRQPFCLALNVLTKDDLAYWYLYIPRPRSFTQW